MNFQKIFLCGCLSIVFLISACTTPKETATNNPTTGVVEPTTVPSTNTPTTDIEEPTTVLSTTTPNTNTKPSTTVEPTVTLAKYSVYFVVNGEIYNEFAVEAGSFVELPTDPYVDNYTFVGWFTNKDYLTLFDTTTPITSQMTLYAKFEEIKVEDLKIEFTKAYGYNEGMAIEFKTIGNLFSTSNYTITYKPSSSSTYLPIDKELIRFDNRTIRCDVLGLVAGSYKFKVESKINNLILSAETDELVVTKFDRSGYAHFNTSTGVGAYNNDGTLKNNAIVVYVSETNKNTVTATINGKSYTGIVSILQAQRYSDVPLVVRIIGTVGAATWNRIEYNGDPLAKQAIKDKNGNVIKSSLNESDIISKGVNTLNESVYSKLNNLTNKLKYSSSEYDSYWNMCDISNAKNVTLEGVGPNAMIFQWGFTWKNCSYIEVRNLIFDDYTEDACSFEGSETSVSSISSFKTGNIWIHHNTFNEGINYWDVTGEQDKHEGDGATDLKGNKNLTISYNHYYKNHKTGLVGGDDSVTTANVTFHHNFYDQCSSRLPLGRQANMHMYNNYYYKSSGTNMSIRANAYAFIENSVFEDCKNTIDIQSGGAVKLWNCLTINSNNVRGTVVSARDQIVTNSNVFCNDFDTNSTQFYYDSVNKKSNVEIMTNVEDVAAFVKNTAGSLAGSFSGVNNDSSSQNPEPPATPSEPEQTTTPSASTTPSTSTPITPGDINSSYVINFNSLSAGAVSSNINESLYYITATSTKNITVYECNETINGQSVTKLVNVGGADGDDYRRIYFSTAKAAQITIYYRSGSTGRTPELCLSTGEQIEKASATTGSIQSYTFNTVEAGNYFISSTNSSIDFYLISIQY